ncbi:IST1 homolog [Juglans microcarpa x Juglans regia]|uniref:IST1 homolog n=1 Tax=Juglans microcarpa x Juglans regia TaxID=2249226 RepID=UPI001B7F04A8|nr:IST1 homolog [Juglans microcarpa x Juglans regia]
MGRKLDALLGRNSKTSKFKTLAKLTISRITILKNQHQVRCSHAHSDVIELLKLGHQERALLRVEHVIKEQNMLDVFAMIANYCDVLIESVELLKKNSGCHDELKEGISSLIFAAARCGEFPELQKLRQILTSTFGKDFADRAVESRNNCDVNPKMIQKLSVRQQSLETRLKVLKEIASEIGFTLHLEEHAPLVVEDDSQKQRQLETHKSANLDGPHLRSPGEERMENEFPESMTARKKYRDVAAAAQEAFESAAYAAAAARAAVALSRSESQDNDPDDHSGLLIDKES